MYQTPRGMLSGGLGVLLPTADDVSLRSGNFEIYRFENQSVHLQPYLAMLAAPTDRFFWQAFTQLEFDVNGSAVFTGGSRYAGKLRDAMLWHNDLAIGYWLVDRPGAAWLNKVAAVFEVHHTTSLTKAGSLVSGATRLGVVWALGAIVLGS